MVKVKKENDKKMPQEKMKTKKGLFSGLLIASFVLDALALAACTIMREPRFGLFLAVIGLILLTPEIIKTIKNKCFSEKRFGFLGAGCILSIVVLGIAIYATLPKSSASVNNHTDSNSMTSSDELTSSGESESKQEYTTLKQLDLVGETISEACEKLKAEGWGISEIGGNNNFQTKSNCNDTTHVVAYVSYFKKKYDDHGYLIDRYEKVNIYFDDSGSNSSANDSSSNSGYSSSNGSASNGNSTNASFRKVMDDYESFMNKYVDFMKRYKNSSDVTSMLSEYSSMMQDYTKFADSIKGYNQNNLSASDWAYYLEVTTRVTKKLAEVL